MKRQHKQASLLSIWSKKTKPVDAQPNDQPLQDDLGDSQSRAASDYFVNTTDSNNTDIEIVQTETAESVNEHCAEVHMQEKSDVAEAEQQPQAWPVVWSETQWTSFQSKYPWLTATDGKLGCSVCASIKSLGPAKEERLCISREWSHSLIACSGLTREGQLANFRVKIKKHVDSDSHKLASQVILQAETKTVEKSIEKITEACETATGKIFKTAYYVAKSDRPFSDFEDLIQLQQLNGIDLGIILHSRHSCVKIISHICNSMRACLMHKLVESAAKLSVMIDESTTLNRKSVLVVNLKAAVGNGNPGYIFLGLLELEYQDAEHIVKKLLSCLHSNGLSDEYLQNNWIAFASDGASVMTGKNSGVATRLREKYPSLFTWHCLNHRLELAVHDAVKEVTAINHFQAFMDKLYSIYSQSPKNARFLLSISHELNVQLLKIGRVFGVRWVASSFRTVKAVWVSYEALLTHFKTAASSNDDSMDDSCTRTTFKSIAKHLESPEFLCNLALMYDTLEELSILSLHLQSHALTLPRAEHLIKRTIRVLESHKEMPGEKRLCAIKAEEDGAFRTITLASNPKIKIINCNQFLQSICNNMHARLCTNNAENDQFLNDLQVFDQADSNRDGDNIRYGECETRRLCRRFKLDEMQALGGLREFNASAAALSTVENLQPLVRAINTLPCSTAECERGFSVMNLIVTRLRTSLNVENIDCLMFVNLNGPPLAMFNPTKFVRTWLQTHRSAADTQSKQMKEQFDEKRETKEPKEDIWRALI